LARARGGFFLDHLIFIFTVSSFVGVDSAYRARKALPSIDGCTGRVVMSEHVVLLELAGPRRASSRAELQSFRRTL
jgi:hypothetical protein